MQRTGAAKAREERKAMEDAIKRREEVYRAACVTMHNINESDLSIALKSIASSNFIHLANRATINNIKRIFQVLSKFTSNNSLYGLCESETFYNNTNIKYIAEITKDHNNCYTIVIKNDNRLWTQMTIANKMDVMIACNKYAIFLSNRKYKPQ